MKRIAAVVTTSLLVLIATSSLGFSTVAVASTAPATTAKVEALVAKATSLNSLPNNLTPPLATAARDSATEQYPKLGDCITGAANLTKPCVFGDTHGHHTMVLWGDSHAEMWFPALEALALREKWKVVVLLELGCPVASIEVANITTSTTITPNTTCASFRTNMIARINKIDPSVVVMSEGYYPITGNDTALTPTMWQQALATTITSLTSKNTKKVIIGNDITVAGAPTCLAAYPTNIQQCDGTDNSVLASYRTAEQNAASSTHALYINEVPWECSSVCTDVVGSMVVYFNPGHISAVYSTYLSGALQAAMKKDLT